jgi:hypothetical protein
MKFLEDFNPDTALEADAGKDSITAHSKAAVPLCRPIPQLLGTACVLQPALLFPVQQEAPGHGYILGFSGTR